MKRSEEEASDSWTESDRQLRKEAGLTQEGAGLRQEVDGREEEEELTENKMPEKAAQVFSVPAAADRESDACWETQSEKIPFIHTQDYNSQPQDYNQHGYPYLYPEDTPTHTRGRGCPHRDALKLAVSMATALLFFPFLLWGGFVFLPFDAPLLPSAGDRLVYTLRSTVFATVPIILGYLVLGVARLRAGLLLPLFQQEVTSQGGVTSQEVTSQEGAVLNGKKRRLSPQQQVQMHRHFLSDSVQLCVLFFTQVVVMAMYLDQSQLKMVPLLTILFAMGRLIYWVSVTFSSSIRGCGFGLSFLPTVAMTIANIYFLFTVEANGSIYSDRAAANANAKPPAGPSGKQRFWG